MKLYQVVGRKAPTSTDASPPAYRMKIFAPNEVMAKSRFWYFMHQMRKMKKTTGEILDVNEITERNKSYIKNFGIWLKYNSRSGTHNMYREYRDVSLNGAVDMLYNDMAGRHRSRNKSIQIIKTATVKNADCKRVTSIEYHGKDIKYVELLSFK
jgi:large subunit ribosomal protein L18Ae